MAPLRCLEASGTNHSVTQGYTPEESRLQVMDSLKGQHQREVQAAVTAKDIVTSLQPT
jgi:hypothetical protein